MGQAVIAAGVPSRTPVGVVAWTANLHSDWAYMAQVEITSETATPEDFNLFWKQDDEGRRRSMEAFRRAGAAIVFSYGKPEGRECDGLDTAGRYTDVDVSAMKMVLHKQKTRHRRVVRGLLVAVGGSRDRCAGELLGGAALSASGADRDRTQWARGF